jgi:hypothetical protein
MLSLFHKTSISLSVLLLALILGTGSARAERKYSFGASIDFMAAMANQAGQGISNSQSVNKELRPSYSIYPSIDLVSQGMHSSFILNYNFAAERFQMNPVMTTTSHTFTESFEAQLGKRAKFRLTDTFNTAPDYSTINVLKGLIPTEQGFRFVFEPQQYKRSNISNNAGIGLDVTLTERSFLTFSSSGSFRRYENEAANSLLSNQSRIEGNFGFSHKQSKRLTWSIKYKVWQIDYENFSTTRSHSALLNLSHQVRPSVQLSLEAGPSYTERMAQTKSSVSYVINASITKIFRTETFSGGYSHLASDSTGLGSSTESHQGTLGFSQKLGRTTTINFQASAFKQMGGSNGASDYWGASGSLGLSQQLGRHWVASMGGSYMGYFGRTGASNNYSSKRVYVSLGYRIGGRSLAGGNYEKSKT